MLNHIDIYWRRRLRIWRWHTTDFAHYIALGRLQVNIRRRRH